MSFKDNPEEVTALLTRWTTPGDDTYMGKIITVCIDRFSDHWDSMACDGLVIINVRGLKHPQGVEPGFGCRFIKAEWCWCWSQIERDEDVEPAKQKQIDLVPEKIRKALSADPAIKNLQWIRIKRINFICHSSRTGVKCKHRPALTDVMFFRFDGGLGLVSVQSKKEVTP
jgi:hypothetical protein